MVRVEFTNPDLPVLAELDAVNFGYNLTKFGDMTVVLVDADGEMISVHTGVRSAFRSGTAPAPAPEPTTAIDISSLPKKKK